MDNGIVEIIGKFESELLDLKTAHNFLGVRTAQYTASSEVSSGRYRITYSGIGIFSSIYLKNQAVDKNMYVMVKTPVNNTQDVEVYISSGTQPLQIISNRPVVSVSPI